MYFLNKLLFLAAVSFGFCFSTSAFLAAEADAAFLPPAPPFLATADLLGLGTTRFLDRVDFFLLDVFLPAPVRAELVLVVFLAFDVFFFEAFFVTLAFLAFATGFF